MIFRLSKHPNRVTQVQVGTLGRLTAGESFEVQDDRSRNFFFYLFAEDEGVEVSFVPFDMDEAVTFTLEKGWNPIKIKRILNAPSGLFFGF